MKLIITNTDQIVDLVLPDGSVAQARVWTGESDGGVPVACWIIRVLVPNGQPEEAYAQFERELQKTELPRPGLPPIPRRQIL